MKKVSTALLGVLGSIPVQIQFAENIKAINEWIGTTSENTLPQLTLTLYVLIAKQVQLCFVVLPVCRMNRK